MIRLLIVAAFVGMQAACSGDSATAPGSGNPPDSAQIIDEPKIEALTPTSIIGIVGELSPVTPAIRVTGARTGKPLANIPVQFVLYGGGTLSSPLVTTDSLGIARAGDWRFGEKVGGIQISVALNGSTVPSDVSFVATLKHGAPQHLRHVASPEQAAIAGHTIDELPVAVEDQFGNRIPGVDVQFSIIEGGGTLVARDATTDPSGVAVAKGWRLGVTPGSNRMIARSGGIAIEFRAEGLDEATLRWYELESISNAGNASILRGAREVGIEGRFAFTAFDRCLCGKQQGYFLDTYVNSAIPYTSATGGVYGLDGTQLIEPRLLDLISGSIEGDRLLLRRYDQYGEFEVTWVYREVKSGQ